MNFENKTILITGASTGIGKALACQLAKYECKLVLTARRENLIREYVSQLNLDENKILILKNDVTDKKSCTDCYEKAVNKFGAIDVAILNAGISGRVTAENYDTSLAEKIYGTNLFGIIYWIEQLLPDYISKKKGVIAGVTSLADNRGYVSGFYNSSKSAASVYLEGLGIELSHYGIRVITIKPAFVDTPLTGKNKFYMPLKIDAEKAAGIIIKRMKKNKRIIQFPWLMVLLTRCLGYIPSNIYSFFAKRVKVR